jgi:voltage-gated potassium channel
MNTLKDKIKIIIFGTDTRGGKLFDLVLIVTIFLSIIIVLLDSVAEFHQKYGELFYAL